MTAKPKVAFYWCASCGGCEEAVVDLAESLLEVAAAVDIVFWPVALDSKRADVEAMDDGEILVSFVNGAVRTTEQEEMVHLLRRKSRLLVAFGSCAHMGGIPGLANLWDRQSIFERAYLTTPTTENPDRVVPLAGCDQNGHHLELPGFYDTVKTLDQVAEVDYVVPGCAPTPKVIAEAVGTLLGGDLPPQGTVLAPDLALCDECDRIDTKPEDLRITRFQRPHEVIADEGICLLAQGLLCLGPATRSGCGALCMAANMPCSGCFGPTGHVRDHGAKILTALASLVGSDDAVEIESILEGIPDPVGTFYRYGLPHSLLVRRRGAVETTA